jgi:BlaI family penicillinase repressor
MSEGSRLTPRELDVMGALWAAGEATVADVRDALADDLAYTTVLTVLRGLEQKGYVEHHKDGRAFRYRPVVPAEAAGTRLVRRLLDRVYQGSPLRLMTHLVTDVDLTEEEVRRMRTLLDERLRDLEDE